MESERLTSEFNEAILQIQRLHNIWLGCRNSREKGNLKDVRWILDSAEIELSNDTIRVDKDIDDTEEKYSKKLDDLNTDIEKAAKNKNVMSFYNNLKNKEKVLRNIQEECGKGSKFRPIDDDLM